MRKGVLVGNGSLRSEKFEELYRLLESAAAERGTELTLVRNTELVLPVGGRGAVPGDNCAGANGLAVAETHRPTLPDSATHTAAEDDLCSGAEGEKERPAPRRGLLFGAGSFGGMTLFGGAVSGLPGRQSARAVEELLAGKCDPGAFWTSVSQGERKSADAAEGKLHRERAEKDGDTRQLPSALPETDSPEKRYERRDGTEKTRAEEERVRLLRQRAGALPEQLQGAEFVLFWDKDILLARGLERAGLPVYNSARAIELCDDKRLTHEVLSAAGIPMPRTVMGPLVFGPCDFEPFVRGVEALFAYPVVVKEAFGSFGAQVYLAKNRAELVALCGSIAPRPFLVSEFIGESAGRDLRLQVVGGKVVAAMERRGQKGDFRAGLTSGGKMFPFTPDRAAETLAVQAAEALGCDFAGVDLLFGEEGYIVCEVNSNAHFKNLFDLTGVNAAGPILDLVLGQSR